jgi:tetratricopeptide (TPR) repeat protein
MRNMRFGALAAAAVLMISVPAAATPASDAMEKGARLKAAGDQGGAIAAYQEAVQTDPANALAHNELGTLLYQAGHAAEAIAEFKRATECDPSYALAYYNYAFSSRKAGRYAEAVSAYQRYEQLKPEDPDAKFGLAESLRALGRNSEAIAAYQAYAAQETRPSEQQWVEKARALAQQLGGQSAAPAPARAVAPEPVSSTTSNPAATAMATGDAALGAHRTADAARAYSDAVRAEPRNAQARFKLGIAYAELGALDRAIEQWQAVLTLDPQNQPARDNIQRAKAKLAAAPSTAPSPAPSSAANAPLGTAPAASTAAIPADVAPAAPDPATAERLARADYEQAVGLISQRRYADSVLALNAAVQLEPGFAVAYVARGSAYVGLGRYSDAIRDYLRGLSLNGNQASPLFGLGEAYRGLGDRQHAAQYYQACAQSTAPDAASVRDLARKRYADLAK